MTERKTNSAGELGPEEAELRGSWIHHGGRTIADAIGDRIEWLLTERLQRLAVDLSGWETLYDPRDGRLWELVYEDSGWHGGGPPSLRVINQAAARAKYGAFKP